MPKDIPSELVVLKNKLNQEDPWIVLLDITLNNPESTIIRLARYTEDVIVTSDDYSDAGLIGYWKLDESSGVVAEDSVNSNDGDWNSGELISNGGFDAWTGAGDAETPDDWTMTFVGWAGPQDGSNRVNEDTAQADFVTAAGRAIRISQADIITLGREYITSIDIKTSDGSTFFVSEHTDSIVGEFTDLITSTGTGVKTETFTGTQTDLRINQLTGGSRAHLVDDVSLKQNIFNSDDSVVFNGADEYIGISNFSALNNMTSGTISIWVKLDVLDSQDRDIIRRRTSGHGWILQVDATDVFRFIVNDGGDQRANGNVAPDIDRLYHVVGTFETDGAVRLYVDSVLQDSEDTVSSSLNLNTSQNITIGTQSAGLGHFDGNISDARIYNKVLSQEEIDDLYNDGIVIRDIPIRYLAFNFDMSTNKMTNAGEIPTVKITVSNIERTLQSYVEDLDGLIGSTCKMTIVNAANLSLDYAELEQTWDIVQTVVTEKTVQFQLSLPNLLRTRYPLTRFLSQHCSHTYKLSECGYVGALPRCKRTLDDCKVHENTTRYGGYPGLSDDTVRVV